MGLSYFQKVSIGKFSLFSISVYITMMSIGNLSVVIHDDRNYPSHYTQSSSLNDSFHLLKLKIAKRLKPSQYEHKFEADLINVNGKKICGMLLLNLAKDSLPLNLNVDDVVLVTGKLQDIKGPLNPGQFNYKKYLENRNIYSQLKIDKTSIKGIDSSTDTYKGYAANIRKEINSRLLENRMSPEVLAITNALLLGQREDISSDIYNNYINAGAVHILAVSGLHVGIILLILQFVFRPLNRIKNGKVYKVALILLFLWAFAIIAGLSASVTRAVTMFSVIAIAINLKRANNIYNALAISVFIILLIKPRFLFDVGFQMSYAAVISIVSFGRIFTNLFYFKN
ncbi:MAG: ComEC/Rec2 family competence protein, partial [Flavobacteriaceae bacterium]|nr:ComEC/Rec2 family competence protein [Flavobacteriaceae bacterium]